MTWKFDIRHRNPITSKVVNDKFDIVYGANAILQGFTVTPGTGLNVSLSSGTAVIQGVFVTKDSGMTIAVSPNTTGGVRTDYLTIEYIHNLGEAVVSVLPANASPVSSSVFRVARIFVQPNAVSIDAKDIEKGVSIDNLYNIMKEKASKAYVDQQISNVSAEGIPKLVSYPYVLTATIPNQYVFTIPLETYDDATDTILVFRNTVLITHDKYAISGRDIAFADGSPVGAKIGIIVFKNVPVGEEGSLNGVFIAEGTMPANRVIENASKRFTSDAEKELWNGQHAKTLGDGFFLVSRNGQNRIDITYDGVSIGTIDQNGNLRIKGNIIEE